MSIAPIIPDDSRDAGVRMRRRRFNLTPIPLQFPSAGHFDAAVQNVLARAEAVEGLRPSSLRWMRDAYRSFRTFLNCDLALEEAFRSGHAIEQVRLLDAWVAWLRQRAVSQTSIRTYWRGLEAVLRRLEHADGFFNPCSALEPPRASMPLPRVLTRSTAEALLFHLRNHPWRSAFEKHRNLAIVGLMLLAGLRKGEVLRLTYGNVDVDAGTIRVSRGKGKYGGKDRTAYATPQLAMILRDYIQARQQLSLTHPEFLSSIRGNRGIGEVTIRRLFLVLSREMRTRITPHMLRHTYATLLRQSGVADRIAQELLGHTSVMMLQRYSHVFDGECATEAARLRLDF